MMLGIGLLQFCKKTKKLHQIGNASRGVLG